LKFEALIPQSFVEENQVRKSQSHTRQAGQTAENGDEDEVDSGGAH
jgi:hypothetical protein